MATWTEAALLAGEGDEHLVAAVGATDARETEVQIAAAKESAGHVTDTRTPRAVAAGVAFVVGPREIAEVNLDGLVQRRMTWLARPVNRGGLCGETDHGDDTWKSLGSEARDMRPNISQAMFSRHCDPLV